jgi:hypothetical protein
VLAGGGERVAAPVSREVAERVASEIFDRHVRAHSLGPLRAADVRRRIAHMVENWEEIAGRPAAVAWEDWPRIAEQAVAQSFGCEAAQAVGWDLRMAVLIAHALLEDVNCHTEAAALLEAARKQGLRV